MIISARKSFASLRGRSRNSISFSRHSVPILRAFSATSRDANVSASSPLEGVFPGGRKIPFVNSINFIAPNSASPIPVYRIMNEDGFIIPGAVDPEVSEDTALRIYSTMVRLSIMDTIFYEAQRQGRISFYMTNWGEEACQIGSAMALREDDECFLQYREAGVFMWRGFTLQNFADQLFSNVDDGNKGRQMPVHYGSSRLHMQTISSPLATQIPQAAGAAYALKVEKSPRVVACYFGEGAASEGDFHAGLNMASTLSVPIIYMCRNNGYAISTPVREQYNGDGIAAKGIGYGIHTLRVDGNDVWAVFSATQEARKIAAYDPVHNPNPKPVLLEFMTYREGHHSTSDDSTRYRSQDEISMWRSNANPIKRLRLYMERKRWWNEEKELALQGSERRAVLLAMTNAERKPPAPLAYMFSDVYAGNLLPHLEKQYEEVKRTERENE